MQHALSPNSVKLNLPPSPAGEGQGRGKKGYEKKRRLKKRLNLKQSI